MKTTTRIVRCILLIGIFLISAPTLFAQDAELVRHFDYDQQTALALKQIGVQHREHANVYDVTYASPKGGVVSAYLVVPKGRGPFAGVIWGHWYWENSSMRNRRQFLDEAVVLAQAGVVSLLPDGPVARPGYVESKEPLNDQQTVNLVHAVVDMRRAADVLLARKDVDPKRLAYVGHSYHAMVGAFLAGVDRRFKAYVLMASSLSDQVDLKTKELQDYRQKVGPEKFDAFIAKYYWTDQGKYVSHASPAVVLVQFANQELFLTPDRAKQHAAVVSEPKQIKFYEAPHALNAEARRDRLQFLIEQLKLKPLPDAAVASIPNLYQPPSPN
jgi:dienelactone hydrolase